LWLAPADLSFASGRVSVAGMEPAACAAIATVFLDAGGVLINPNWVRVSQVLRRRGVQVEPAVLAAADAVAKRRLDTAEVVRATNDATRLVGYLRLVLSCAGVAGIDDSSEALGELTAYHAAQNLWEAVPPEVVPALERLRAAGLRLVVVSNANGTLHGHLERLGLAHHFDAILDSGVEGVEKPDARFFELALARSGAARETTMHVGDLYHVDVVGARAAGVRPILLDVADLYRDADCERVPSLTALTDRLTAGSH
jgi:putative hydrolase of the HAD superfamily